MRDGARRKDDDDDDDVIAFIFIVTVQQSLNINIRSIILPANETRRLKRERGLLAKAFGR